MCDNILLYKLIIYIVKVQIIKNRKTLKEPKFLVLFIDTVPELIYTFIEQNVRPGPLISLKCSASGSPPPQVSTLPAMLKLHIAPIKVASCNCI